MKDPLDQLVQNFLKHSREDDTLLESTKYISVGVVTDVDDPLQQGRLRVFCPAYNDDPKKILHLPWVAYVSPVGGVIDNSNYARGHIEGKEFSSGPLHYGMWAIPEVGAHVLVACINNDVRRRVWLGCLPSHQETHTIGHGKFQHAGDKVNGPHTSTGNPIEPTKTKLSEAFDDDLTSSEWKTRGADYQITSVIEPPSPHKSVYVDDNHATMNDSERDYWVGPIMGDNGYDWTSFKNLGSFLASKVYSLSTPGFHSFQMDDRPFNSRIRIRTTAGNQIILDDTNERIYFSVSGGKSWLEMDAAGNVDVFADRRFSVHSKKDINFSSDESIRFTAGKFISMYAGPLDIDQTPLNEPLRDGEIRIQSSDDIHLMSGRDLQVNVYRNTAANFGHHEGGIVEGTTNLNFDGDVNIGTEGNFGISALGDINLESRDITFTIQGHSTTVDDLTTFLDTFIDTYNLHTHINAGLNLKQSPPLLPIEGVVITVEEDITSFAPWTNRVPDHEPWPRVLMQDSGDSQNNQNSGYIDNVGWVPQYDNIKRPTGSNNKHETTGRSDIGRVEGDEVIIRGKFWRR